jgi:hypothetical protein
MEIREAKKRVKTLDTFNFEVIFNMLKTRGLLY